MIMPNLLFEKPPKNSKAKDHLTALEKRMQSWLKGDLMGLLHEGETIQKNLTQQLMKEDTGKISKKFTVFFNLLTENMRNGILPLNNETLNLLRLKHPDPKDAHESVMLSDIPERKNLKFEVIDAETIRKAGMKTMGGSGPSGLDADGWNRIY